MRLSIIIVTFNSQEHVQSCLDAVFRQGDEGVEVIVVDNGSKDATLRILKENYRQVRLIENSGNEGACRARNQGIAASSGDWVLTLDSDVVIGDDFIRQFISASFSFADNIGMVQADILNEDGETVYSHGIDLTFLRRFHDLNRGRKKVMAIPAEGKIIGPCSAAAFYRRKMLEKLKEVTGYFDERFFFLVEDVDLAWRARLAGWAVLFCPRITCTHTGNGSQTGRDIRQYLCIRNRYWMITKNDRFGRQVLVHIVSFPYELIRGIYWFFFNNHMWKSGSSVMRAERHEG